MLSADRVCWQLGQANILRGLSFELNVGEHLAVLGPNGAGKSSLLGLLSADEQPSSGSLQFLQQDLDQVPVPIRSARVAVLSQQPIIRFPFKVWELVAMGRFPFNDQTQTLRIVDEVLNALELAALKYRSILSLSGGEIQRVHLARALTQVWSATAPSLLLLDEPLSSLDVAHQVLVRNLLKRLLAQLPLSIISVIHDLSQAAEDFDKALLISRDGVQKAFGPPLEVLTPVSLSALYSSEIEAVFDRDGRPRGFRVCRG
jgi:iron complex transport system ATP-binding protein